MRTYCRIEQPSTDAKEDPNIDGQREAKCKRDVEQRSDVHGAGTEEVVGDLRCSESEEQEEKGAHEFAKA